MAGVGVGIGRGVYETPLSIALLALILLIGSWSWSGKGRQTAPTDRESSPQRRTFTDTSHTLYNLHNTYLFYIFYLAHMAVWLYDSLIFLEGEENSRSNIPPEAGDVTPANILPGILLGLPPLPRGSRHIPRSNTAIHTTPRASRHPTAGHTAIVRENGP